MSTFRQLGAEGDANGPQFAPLPAGTEPASPRAGQSGGRIEGPVNRPIQQLHYDAGWTLWTFEKAQQACDRSRMKEFVDTLEDQASRARAAIKAGSAANDTDKDEIDATTALVGRLERAANDARLGNGCPTGESPGQPVTASNVVAQSQAVPADLRTSPVTRPDPRQQRLLDLTNALRLRFGLSPLRWNPTLAAGAADAASHLGDIGQVAHASRDGRGDVRENVLRIRVGASPDEMFQVWSAELRDLMPGILIFPDVALDGHWERVAHLTQIIWPDTTEMGCAWVERDGYIYLVCRYSPGGNKDGRPVGLMSARSEDGTYKRRQEYCSKQEQIDDLLALQSELIRTDESWAEGHLYGDAIRAEIARVKQAKIHACEPKVDTASIDLPVDVQPPKHSTGMATTTSATTADNGQVGADYTSSIKQDSSAPAAATLPGHAVATFNGPLLFTTMQSDPKWLNPKGLEFGRDAVNAWVSLQVGLQRCDFPRADAALGKLEYYAQTAREHSAEEKSKGNSGLSQSYADMAKQIDEKVAEGDDRLDHMDNCRQPERG